MDTSQTTFTVFTLFDITCTGVTRVTSSNQFQRNQQRNWETLLQLIGLRTQITIVKYPTILDNQKLSNYKFGSDFKKSARIWSMTFSIENAGIFSDGHDPIAHLKHDVDLIPMVANLNETVKFDPVCTQVHGPKCNIYFT